MVSMRTLYGFADKLKKNGAHRLLALALVFLIALNILVTALPKKSFESVSAEDDSSRLSVMTLHMDAGTSVSMRMVCATPPVIQTEPEGDTPASELSFWTITDGSLNDNYSDPYVFMSYTDPVLTYNIYSEYDSIIMVFAKDPTIIKALAFENGTAPCGVTELKINSMPALASIDVSGLENLEKLSLVSLPALTAVDASDCSIEEIRISNAPAITSLGCSGNNLHFETLLPSSLQPDSYGYASQSDVEIPAYVSAGSHIDLSDCYVIDNIEGGTAATEYKWYFSDGTEVTEGITPAPSGFAGDFSIDPSLSGKTIYCVMTHAAYPEITELKTTPCTVTEDLQVIVDAEGGAELFFTVSGTDAFSVFSDGTDLSDCVSVTPDGNTLVYNVTLPEGASKVIAVTSAAPITAISTNGKLGGIDVSSCTSLRSLDIAGSDTPLNELDLSSNKALERLCVTDCSLGNIDLSENSVLNTVNLSGNNLTDISLPASVTDLDITGNRNLGSLDCTSVCSGSLRRLAAPGCGLKTADLSAFSSLTDLDLSLNFIDSIAIPENDYTYINISYNELTFETLPSYPLTITKSDFEYIYANQTAITLAGPYSVNTALDVTGYMKSSAEGDKVTAWLTGESGNRISDSDGIITIPYEFAGDTIRISIESEKFPDLEIKSNTAKVDEVLEFTNAAVAVEGSGPFSFSVVSTMPVLVDWGDGNEIEYKPADGDYSKPVEISGTTVAGSDGYAHVNIITAGSATALDLGRDEGDKPVRAVNTELWTDLETLDLSGNNLRDLDISKNTALKKLDVSGNALTFKTLPAFSGEYVYSPQQNITIEDTVTTDEKITLSDSGAVTYKWYNASTKKEITPKTSNNGEFTFGDSHDGITAYCEMTSSAFPDLTLRTTDAKLKVNETVFDAPVAVLYTDLTKDQKFSLAVSCDEPVYIDWGNGTPVSSSSNTSDVITAEKELKGTSIKLYTNGKLTMISATDMQVTKVKLASATDLEVLNLSGNKLDSIDLSKNNKIKTLDLSDNRFVFSTLPVMSSSVDYSYAPQPAFKIASVKGTDTKFSDLKALTATVGQNGYTWYKKNSSGNDTLLSLGSDYSSPESGVFVFDKKLGNETVYCVVSNTAYPDLKIKTTEMKLLPGGDLTMNDATGLVYDINIVEGSTCKDSAGNTIPAGDLNKSTTSTSPMLTFNSKKFANTTALTTEALLAKVKTKLTTFDSTKGMYYIYDFTLRDSKGMEVTDFSGSVNITVKYPNTTVASRYNDYTFYMFHYFTSGIKAGTIEELAITSDSSGLTFTATSFSPYILVYQEKSPTNDSTDNGSNNGSGTGNSTGSGAGSGSSGSGSSGGSNDGKGPSSPQTGDDSEGKVLAATVILWVSVILMAAVSVTVLIRKKSRG